MFKTILIAFIRGYRFALSPWLGNACRYWPTCSEYSMQAIEQHGAWRGGWMMLTRLARCHPYAAGGVDPVPAQFSWRCWCQRDDTESRSLTSFTSPHEH
ncbi:MAG TPA: membrane protein insertion efficiency factor YidD [Burkholderiaceae bacterium]|jgi:putative membrane protein insertion efficiency factor|nr:membrane protein insertion efficiency factor YidD [Burkholderiaceae bacterium]